MPTIVNPTQGKVDVPLSIYAREYRNNAMIGELLFPRVSVLKQSDKYWKFGRENQRVTANTLRAPGAAAEQVVQTISTDNYACDDRSLARVITDEERGNFEAGNVEQWATRLVTDQLLLDYEKRAATLATTLANYPAANRKTLAGAGGADTNQWGTGTTNTGQPVKNVLDAHLQVMKSGKKANTLILGPEVFALLKDHEHIKARVTASGGKAGRANFAVVTEEDLAAIFEVERVLVAAAVELDAALTTASFVWGKHAILANIEPAASMMDISFGKTFVWTAPPVGGSGGFATVIGKIPMPSSLADELSVHWYHDLKITSDISAYFIQNAVA